MLELLFQGLIEWLYGLVLECWQYFSSSLLEIMSLDFAYLKSHVPVLDEIMQILPAVGWALLIGNLAFQALRSMASGLGFEGEDPKLLFTRTFVFAFLLLASPQICEIGLNITSTIMTLLDIPDAVQVGFVDESAFSSMTASWLLVIICGIIVMFKILRLLLEIAERYVILAMLTITAPLAFSMGGSRSTSEIFTGWCRMYGSMCVLMVTNVIFFKMLLSVLSAVPSGTDIFPWMVLVMTIVKVARKADAIITRIGLNPAITSDSLGVRLPGALTYMVVRSVGSTVTKALGNNASGAKGGKAGGPPPSSGSGGPKNGGPAGPKFPGGSTAANTSYTQQQAQQSTSQQTAARENTAQQSTNTQFGSAQAGGNDTPAGTQPAHSAQVRSGGSVGSVSRKTAVPPGTRRAPSHVKSSILGTPGNGPNGTTINSTVAGGAVNVSTPGTAGTRQTPVSARFTQAPQPDAHASAEQRSSAMGGSQPVRPGQAGAQKTQTESTVQNDVRFSQRAEQSQPMVSRPGKDPISAPAAAKSGTAGTPAASAQQTSSNTRYSRNRPPTFATPSAADAKPANGTAGITPTSHQKPSAEARPGRNTVPSPMPPSNRTAKPTPGTAGTGVSSPRTVTEKSAVEARPGRNPAPPSASFSDGAVKPVAGTTGTASISRPGAQGQGQQARQRRNTLSTSTAPSSVPRQQNPAPQETRRSSATNRVSSPAASSKPQSETSGTAAEPFRVSQRRQTPRESLMRGTPAPPPASGKPDGKTVSDTSTTGQKPTRMTSEKPEQKEGRDEHG